MILEQLLGGKESSRRVQCQTSVLNNIRHAIVSRYHNFFQKKSGVAYSDSDMPEKVTFNFTTEKSD